MAISFHETVAERAEPLAFITLAICYSRGHGILENKVLLSE